jgi:serine/threonine-protein kinase
MESASAKAAHAPFRMGEWTVEPSLNRITRGQEVAQIRPLLMDLLVFLADSGGRVIPKDELIEHVWEARFVSDSALARSLTELRQSLGDSPEDPRYIQTIPKRGYRMVASVALVTRENEPGRRDAIAVLPFQDLSAGHDQEYFCDGLADELINSLTQVAGLRVVARTSAFAFKQTAMDVREIGRRLNAGALVEGGLQRSGQRLRITVQLIETKEGYHVWSERFDGTLDDVFALEDQIARAVVEKLRLRLSPDTPLVRPYTANAETYRLCLQGRQFYCQATRDSFLRAMECYRQAIHHDPLCARAWAGLADCLWDGAEVGFLTGANDLTEGRQAAVRAVELDPSLAEAHATLGIFRGVHDFDWPAAGRHFQEALRLSPASPIVHERYAMFCLQPQLRMDEAEAHLLAALEVDPLSPFLHANLSHLLMLRREYGRATEEAQHALSLQPQYLPAFAILATIAVFEGRFQELLSLGGVMEPAAGDNPVLLAGMGWGLAMAGQTEPARQILASLKIPGRFGRTPSLSIAWVHQGLGEPDQALDWLERAVEERDPKIVFLRTKPFWDSLRPTARFTDLLRKMRLV